MDKNIKILKGSTIRIYSLNNQNELVADEAIITRISKTHYHFSTSKHFCWFNNIHKGKLMDGKIHIKQREPHLFSIDKISDALKKLSEAKYEILKQRLKAFEREVANRKRMIDDIKKEMEKLEEL